MPFRRGATGLVLGLLVLAACESTPGYKPQCASTPVEGAACTEPGMECSYSDTSPDIVRPLTTQGTQCGERTNRGTCTPERRWHVELGAPNEGMCPCPFTEPREGDECGSHFAKCRYGCNLYECVPVSTGQPPRFSSARVDCGDAGAIPDAAATDAGAQPAVDAGADPDSGADAGG